MAGLAGGLSGRTASPRPRPGIVSLVGAGPGDAGLLTLAAARRLRDADVVYHDALVTAEVLSLCRRRARVVNVGKRRGASPLSQAMIEKLIVRDARAGLAVVRLKGGDPYVFGRGGEEALALRRRGVPFEIVPGLTSGTSVPALAGIPLTHRGLAGSAAFVTAHDLSETPSGDAARERLGHLARGADTIIVFMAGAETVRVREALLDAGLPPETPAAVIESGSWPGERISTGTVQDLHRLKADDASGPVLIVIGKTVALSQELRSPAFSRAAAPWAASRERLATTGDAGRAPRRRTG